MAPGRRRGAKGAKMKSQLNYGDLVLAKVKGHPAWPAKIGRPEDWERTPDPKKCFVHFFGTDEIAFVAPDDIQEFTIEAKNKLAARCKSKTVKYFATAVKEICAAFEELQNKSSCGVGADPDIDELHRIPENSCKEHADRSAAELKSPVEETEKSSITPNDRRHCVLEDVDGELEMEDVSVHQKDERAFTSDALFETVSKEQDSNRIFDADLSSSEQFPFPMGSPPSPPESPPPTPPLPNSPRPVSRPPPPPLSPSPPPPPPAPLLLQAQSHPPPPVGMLPSVIPQSSVLPPLSVVPQGSQPLHTFQSSVPSSSPRLAYQLQDTQLPQLTGNNPHGVHVDVNSRNEMYPQPHPFTNPQAPQPSQFQTVPFSQRPFYPAPPPQVPSSHFSYSNPVVQQRPPHPYTQPYKLPAHPDGPRQYHTEDKWRMQSNVFSTNNLHGPWMNGVRSSSVPVHSFAHEGYFRPPVERPPSIPPNFQQSAVNAIPAGPPISGHIGPRMMPSRPDSISLGSWKPA